MEVFRSVPSTSTPTIRPAEVPDEVRALITDGMFYGTSGVLTSVSMHHPDLDFAAICSGYADGWSLEQVGGGAVFRTVGDGCPACECG